MNTVQAGTSERDRQERQREKEMNIKMVRVEEKEGGGREFIADKEPSFSLDQKFLVLVVGLLKRKHLKGVESEAATLWEVSGYERLPVMPLHVGAADRDKGEGEGEGKGERQLLSSPLNF